MYYFGGGEPHITCSKPWILIWKRIILEHQLPHYKPQLSPDILFKIFQELYGILHGGENAGYLSGDRKVGTEWTSVSSFPLTVIQLTVLVFSPSPHYCSALSLSLLWRSVGLSAPGSVCTGLQLPGLFLPLAPSHLSSNFQKGVYWWLASLCCFYLNELSEEMSKMLVSNP